MSRYRTLSILLFGSVLLLWEFVAAAPPAAKDAKSKKNAAADEEKTAKSSEKSEKSSTISKKEPADAASKPEKVVKTDAEWRRILTPLQFKVTRKKFTEPAGSNPMAHSKKDGVYHCICCGEPLFDSKAKFESGTGWPSFFQTLKEEAVTNLEDTSDGELRTEVQCSRCDAHLGHVFSDGPEPTGLRYCMNGASLKFVDRKKEQVAKEAKSAPSKGTKKGQETDKESAKESKDSQ